MVAAVNETVNETQGSAQWWKRKGEIKILDPGEDINKAKTDITRPKWIQELLQPRRDAEQQMLVPSRTRNGPNGRAISVRKKEAPTNNEFSRITQLMFQNGPPCPLNSKGLVVNSIKTEQETVPVTRLGKNRIEERSDNSARKGTPVTQEEKIEQARRKLSKIPTAAMEPKQTKYATMDGDSLLYSDSDSETHGEDTQGESEAAYSLTDEDDAKLGGSTSLSTNEPTSMESSEVVLKRRRRPMGSDGRRTWSDGRYDYIQRHGGGGGAAYGYQNYKSLPGPRGRPQRMQQRSMRPMPQHLMAYGNFVEPMDCPSCGYYSRGGGIYSRRSEGFGARNQPWAQVISTVVCITVVGVLLWTLLACST